MICADNSVPALELFCGIGGFAAAVAGSAIRVAAAFDQDRDALRVYRLNFPRTHPRLLDLERIGSRQLQEIGAHFWWLSPPCQPYCARGARRDLNDPRARSLLRLLEILEELPDEFLPLHLALENVPGFEQSEARCRLLDVLALRGYGMRELSICPTDLGVPSRRPRYYLAASLEPLHAPAVPAPCRSHSFPDYVSPIPPDHLPYDLLVPPEILDRFGAGLRILHPDDADAYTTCFTSGYGRSLMHAGSYVRCGDAVRRFTPEEIAGFLHFPREFRFPEDMPTGKRWRLVGNSLSIVAVREVLRVFSGLDPGPRGNVNGWGQSRRL